MQPRLIPEPLRFAGGPLLKLQSDERLVRLVRAGSHPAFAEVVQRYRPALVRYANRIAGEERGEDVVQQGLANAHTALMADDRPIDLKPWLYRIAHNAALNVLRGDRELLTLDDHEQALVVPGAESQAEQRERFRTTLRAVQALPNRQRDALLLRELEGRSHEEIATALGVSPGAARQHLMRARVTLRTAATAITPYPLLLRLTAFGTDGGLSGLPPGSTIAGAGAGVGLSKLAVGLLAAGALAGGTGVAVVRTARPDAVARGAQRAPARTPAPVLGVAAAASRTVAHGAASTAAVTVPRDAGLGGAPRGGRGDHAAGDDKHGSSSSSGGDEGHTSDSGSFGRDGDGALGPRRDGSSGSDDARSSGSGTSGSATNEPTSGSGHTGSADASAPDTTERTGSLTGSAGSDDVEALPSPSGVSRSGSSDASSSELTRSGSGDDGAAG